MPGKGTTLMNVTLPEAAVIAVFLLALALLAGSLVS